MDWDGLGLDLKRRNMGNFRHLPVRELEDLARLALAGKALAEAVKGRKAAWSALKVIMGADGFSGRYDEASKAYQIAHRAEIQALEAWDEAEGGQ